MNCTSVTPQSIVVCRLCTKSHEYFVNIFISNESCEIMVEEAIQDLLGLPVGVGDGLPNVVCRLCLRKLIEFREFKNMCFKSATELRAYALGNDFLVSKVKDEDSADVETSRGGSNQENSFLNDIHVTEVYLTTPDELAIGNVSHSKEDLWSSEKALVVKEEVNDGGNYAEDDVPVTALANVAVDPLAVDTMVSKIKDEDAADLETSRDGSNPENTFMNDIHVTEMYITTPDELAIGNVSQAKEEFISSENVLVVKEEVNDGEHGIEGDMPVTALASVAVDPLAVDTMSHAKEEFISSENILVVKEDVNDGEHGIEGDMPVTALASVAVDPLAVDTMVDRCKNIGKLTLEPEKELDKFGAERHWISQEKLINNPSCDPVHEENLQVELSRANLFAVNCFPESRVKNHGTRPVKNHEREQLCHQAENASSPTDYICNYCSTRCLEKKSLARHIKRHLNGMRSASVLPKEFQPGYSQNQLVKTFKCNECGKMFTCKSKLKSHVVVHTDVKPFKCNECGKMFSRSGALKMHSRIHSGVKPFKCNECGKMFSRSGDLKRHSRIHSGVKPFRCNECGKMFSQKGYLKAHSVVHTGVKTFKCNDCGKMFTSKSKLRSHVVVHTGVKPFKCNECGKMFSRSGELKTHSRIHSGVKPFRCNECGKMFTRSSSLNKHSVVHTGVKPFKCNECGKMFSTKHYLKMHSVFHAGVKSFKCNECGKLFFTKSNLKKHSRIHSGVNPL